ncbi:MAG: trigger factor [Candidatus Ratteibacteria bacterium]|nr:trigger factor [Candidatus Ratteibacteria bacterium]
MENVKVEIIERSVLGRELSFVVDKEKVEKARKSIIAEIRENAEIEGFRKGKAPEEIIEKKFGQLINENLIKRIVPDVYIETIREQGLRPITEPDVFDVSFNEEGMKFKVYLELKPDVELKKYKGIPVKRITPEPVTEKEVEDVLAEWEKQPSFASAIIDPVKRRAWKEKIRQQLESYKKANALMQENKQLWDEVFRDVDFPVPDKMVREEGIRYTEEQLRHMDIESKSEEEKEKIVKELFEKVKPEAVVSVKRYFVLDKIAEMEKIEVDEEELNKRIEEISRSAGEPPQQIRQKFEKADRLDALKDEIRIQKAFMFMRENAKFIEKIILPGEEKKVEIIK